MYELTVFVLMRLVKIASRVCLLYSVSFSRIIALSGVALALTAQLVYRSCRLLSIPFLHFFLLLIRITFVKYTHKALIRFGSF